MSTAFRFLTVVAAGLLSHPAIGVCVEWSDDWAYATPSSGFRFEVKRLDSKPIIHAGLSDTIGKNINGPSLIRVPSWVKDPLGKYYLYFAHHNGKHIRLAYADRLEGPWKIHEPGVLSMADAFGRGHIASPDVHVDEAQQRIRMYFHQPAPKDSGWQGQVTWAALSNDGLRFKPREEVLGKFYFRVFEHGDWHYAVAKYFNDGGVLYRSRDGLADFEEGPRVLPSVRHTALWKHDGKLYVFFSRIGDAPEQILVSRVENLADDWRDWKFTEPQTVIAPELDYEGASEPVVASRAGAINRPARQLRDPAIFVEDGRLFLLYSTAGERAIAMAEIRLIEESK